MIEFLANLHPLSKLIIVVFIMNSLFLLFMLNKEIKEWILEVKRKMFLYKDRSEKLMKLYMYLFINNIEKPESSTALTLMSFHNYCLIKISIAVKDSCIFDDEEKDTICIKMMRLMNNTYIKNIIERKYDEFYPNNNLSEE